MRTRYWIFVGLLWALLDMGSVQAQITWRRTYGGFGSDDAASVRQTADGGYIVAGTSGSFGAGSSDIYVVRVDALGEHIWSRVYGGPGTETGIACRELADGFVIAGTTSTGAHGAYDMFLIRTDADGEPMWQREYGSADWDLCNAMTALPDGFVLGGISYGPAWPAGAAYVVRTDMNGDTLWTKMLGGAFKKECLGLAATDDLGIIVVGSKDTSSASSDATMTRLDALGEEQWTTVLGGDSTDLLIGVVQTSDGGFVGCGRTNSQIGTSQVYVVKVLEDGSLDWERYIGSGSDAGGREVQLDHNGGYVLTGFNTLNGGNPDMIFTVTDGGGWFQSGYNYGDGASADGYSIDTTDDGGYVVAGWCESYGPGPRAMYVVKADSTGHTEDLTVQTFFDPVGVNEIRLTSSASFHPNPIEPGGQLIIGSSPLDLERIELRDMQGRLVLQRFLTYPGTTLQMPMLATGTYQLTTTTKAGSSHSSLLIVR